MYVPGDKVRIKGKKHLTGYVREYVAASCGSIDEPAKTAKVKVCHANLKATLTYCVTEVTYA